VGWFKSVLNRLIGRSRGPSAPAPATRPAQVHTYPRMPKPFAGVTPNTIVTDEQNKDKGDYDKAYPKGQRTNNQAGEAPNRDQIPDEQKFASPYSTWVASFLWKRYRGRNVIGGGEGTITIEFVNGTVCEYRACSYKLYRDFTVAPSKGQFVNAFFRPRPYILIKKGTKRVQRRKPHIAHKFYPKTGQSIPRGTP
jgi:hypothetical protein